MADTEEPQFSTLAERIAALNKQKAFTGNGLPATGNGQPARRPPPPPPPSKKTTQTQAPTTQASTTPVLPPRPARNGPPLPVRRDTQTSVDSQATEQPARPPLPSRTPSAQQTPPMPPRRPSTQQNGTLVVRRNSASSELSISSGISSLSMGGRTASSTTSHSSNGTAKYNLPPVVDMSQLPKLPPTRRERELKAKEEEERQAEETRKSQEARRAQPTVPVRPPIPKSASSTQPPTLPSRPVRNKSNGPTLPERSDTVTPNVPPRRLPPPATAKARITGFGSGKEDKPPPLPTSSRESKPPPVPTSSRPSIADIDAASARAVAPSSTPAPPGSADECLICHDFSVPDEVGSRFPRESLPHTDPAGYLATNLCSQFPSYTDKARAIFAWCHHNIAYDTYSFFGGCVKAVPVNDTLLNGLAVCQGYAEAYQAIAVKAGLECIVISGYGKGYGYTPLKPGESIPPMKSNHAWNAVRIDGGIWKVIDACWGAGALGGETGMEFTKGFTPHEFTRSNIDMGVTHFPQDPSHQFREDGTTTSWETFYVGAGGEGPSCCGDFTEAGFEPNTAEPRLKNIPIYSGEVVRFKFARKCAHWKTRQMAGKGEPLLFMSIAGRDGRKATIVPIQNDGYWFWADVNAIDLGAPGQGVQIMQITSFDNREPKGVTQKEVLARWGRVGWKGSYLARWDLVRA